MSSDARRTCSRNSVPPNRAASRSSSRKFGDRCHGETDATGVPGGSGSASSSSRSGKTVACSCSGRSALWLGPQTHTVRFVKTCSAIACARPLKSTLFRDRVFMMNAAFSSAAFLRSAETDQPLVSAARVRRSRCLSVSRIVNETGAVFPPPSSFSRGVSSMRGLSCSTSSAFQCYLMSFGHWCAHDGSAWNLTAFRLLRSCWAPLSRDQASHSL